MDILNYVGAGGSSFGSLGSWSIVFLIIMIWSLFWKGLALWSSVKRGEKIWFIVLLIVNTVGILEIIYLFVITKEGKPLLNSTLDKVKKGKLL